MGAVIRVTIAAFLAGLGGTMLQPLAARAEPATPSSRMAQSSRVAIYHSGATDVSAQRRPRTRVRIYSNSPPDDVYPRYDPGPNAVRVCNANYVQEFRPSGTVIVPHMSCYWRRG